MKIVHRYKLPGTIFTVTVECEHGIKNNVCKCKYTNMWLSKYLQSVRQSQTVFEYVNVFFQGKKNNTDLSAFSPQSLFPHLFYYTESFFWHRNVCPVCYQGGFGLLHPLFCFVFFYFILLLAVQKFKLTLLSSSLLVTLYKSTAANCPTYKM